MKRKAPIETVNNSAGRPSFGRGGHRLSGWTALIFRILSWAVAAAVLIFAGGTVMAAESCRDLARGADRYTVCSFDPAARPIRVYDFDPQGAAYQSFDRLALQLWREHRNFPLFATNGGMYRDDYSAVGLLVENGIERRAISTRGGWGNFHLQPNGVFFVDGDKAGVLDTQAYLRAGIKPAYATQSGPMLVVDGKIHPKFLADSDSFKRRNGVGVDAAGRVHFVISEGGVRFYDFAALFRDELQCANALFLDGSISSVHIPERRRSDRFFPMGPIIAVVGSVPD